MTNTVKYLEENKKIHRTLLDQINSRQFGGVSIKTDKNTFLQS